MSEASQRIMQRLEALAQISEESNQLTRTYGSPAMRRANALVADWMIATGMVVLEDEIGNIIGRYDAAQPGARTLLLGSHLDTVRDAGKFDGALGVLIALACVEHLHATRQWLPFALKVIGFTDEEGVRFQSSYLGSRAFVGTLTDEDLKCVDSAGVTLEEAISNNGGEPIKVVTARCDPKQLLGYVEVHIEQGSVLEQQNVALGIATAIAGQSRIRVRFTGKAGHAGTTPMPLRRDALSAAAEFIFAVETHARDTSGLVATVGQIQVAPGASNVIPGEANLTLDIRHQTDTTRLEAVAHLQRNAEEIGRRRDITVSWEIIQQTASVPSEPALTSLLKHAAQKHQPEVIELPSGAGHDAAVFGKIMPMTMLLVRCKDGLSHHPNESASVEDIAVALNVMNDFLQLLAQKHG